MTVINSIINSITVSKEFLITQGMLVQFKVDHRDRFIIRKPDNVFTKPDGNILDRRAHVGRVLPNTYPNPNVSLTDLADEPKHVLHVIEGFTICHPNFEHIKTRYLKCQFSLHSEDYYGFGLFYDEIQPKSDSIYDFEAPKVVNYSNQIFIGYVRDSWVEPLTTKSYLNEYKERLKAILHKK
jgi:hypothetical protein